MIDLKARAEALKKELADKEEAIKQERIQQANLVAATPSNTLDYQNYKTHRSFAGLPIFSPTKTVSFEELNYTSADKSLQLKVIPSVSYGRPTIYDHDVWLFILDRVANAYRDTGAIPTQVSFTLYECLKALGRADKGENYKSLVASLDRLANFSFKITTVGEGLNIGLCRYRWMDLENGNRRVVVILDPTVKSHMDKTPHLFLAPPNYRLTIDVDRPLAKQMVAVLRPRLGRQPQMPAMKWDTLREMLGYKGRLCDFKRDVLAALPHLDFGLRIEGEGKGQKLTFFNH